MRPTTRPLAAAGLLLGMGLAGFVDGIVLHQILQWHHMVCRTETCRPTSVADFRRKNTEDGYFHLAVLGVSATGVAALFRAGGRPDVPWSGRVLAASVLGGFGLFNVAEGLVDHQWLGIHHVRPGPGQFAWDMGFLAVSAALVAAGWALGRSGRAATSAGGAPAA